MDTTTSGMGLAERRAILRIALLGTLVGDGLDRRLVARLCENDGQARALEPRRLAKFVRDR